MLGRSTFWASVLAFILVIQVAIFGMETSPFHTQQVYARDGDADVGAEILQHRGYTDPSGIYHVVGEIKNTGDQPLGFVSVSVVFYNEEGDVITSDKVFTRIHVVLPGHVVPFDASALGRNIAKDIHSYEISATAQVVKEKPQLLHINTSFSYVDGLGLYHLTGTVVNDGDRHSTFTGVVATFYDNEGRIITTERDLTAPLNVPAGESGEFKITVHRDLADRIAVYSLDAESNEFLTAQYEEMQSTNYPHVAVQWTPRKPTAEQEVTIIIIFKNPGAKVPRTHIDYTLTISKEGDTVYTISQHTHSGTDTIKQKLASDGVYTNTITITGIDFEAVEPRSGEFSIIVGRPSTQPQQEPQPIIPKGQTAVEIDGLWTSEIEWMDSSEMKIEDEELLAYLRAKHDEAFVYILIDFISDQGLESGDFAAVCFDTKSNGGDAPLPDDYCFYRVARSGQFLDGIIQGNGARWAVLQEAETWDPYDEKFDAAIAYSHANDPYDDIYNHVSYEFRIPIGSYGLDETMGFYLYVNDAFKNKFVEWPASAGDKQFKLIVKDVLPSPDKWGDLHLELDKKEADFSKPQARSAEEERAEVRVQAKQIRDLVIVRLRNMDDSRADIHAFKILLPGSSLKAFKGPKEWSKEGLVSNEAVFSTSTEPIHAGDKEYFLLRVDGLKPDIQWIVYGQESKKLAEGSIVPFLR